MTAMSFSASSFDDHNKSSTGPRVLNAAAVNQRQTCWHQLTSSAMFNPFSHKRRNEVALLCQPIPTVAQSPLSMLQADGYQIEEINFAPQAVRSS
jgi:hypothetical protein